MHETDYLIDSPPAATIEADIDKNQYPDDETYNDTGSYYPEVDYMGLIIYTTICILCVTIITLLRCYIFDKAPRRSKVQQMSTETLTETKQSVESKRVSLEAMKKDLGVDTEDLRDYASRLKLKNRQMAERLSRLERLGPVTSSLNDIKVRLGKDYEDRICARKQYLSLLTKLEDLKRKNDDIRKSADAYRYEQIKFLEAFVEKENIPSLIRDIEFRKKFDALTESMFEDRVEIDMLDEHVLLFRRLSEQYVRKYDQLCNVITQAQQSSEDIDRVLKELRLSRDEIQRGDEDEKLKKMIVDKQLKTDEFYKNYLQNYNLVIKLTRAQTSEYVS